MYSENSLTDELRDVRHWPRFVRIDAALEGQKYGIGPSSTASVRINLGRRLALRNSSIECDSHRAGLTGHMYYALHHGRYGVMH